LFQNRRAEGIIRLNSGLIRLIVTASDFKAVISKKERLKREAVFNMVTREDWLEQLKKCLSILTPINKYLVKFQKDSVPLSDVYQCCESLPFEFEENQYLSHVDKAYLKKLVMGRWNFCYSDAHGVAYLLDPRFTGSRMDLDLKEKVLEFV
jgi:hypothetical protein